MEDTRSIKLFKFKLLLYDKQLRCNKASVRILRQTLKAYYQAGGFMSSPKGIIIILWLLKVGVFTPSRGRLKFEGVKTHYGGFATPPFLPVCCF